MGAIATYLKAFSTLCGLELVLGNQSFSTVRSFSFKTCNLVGYDCPLPQTIKEFVLAQNSHDPWLWKMGPAVRTPFPELLYRFKRDANFLAYPPRGQQQALHDSPIFCRLSRTSVIFDGSFASRSWFGISPLAAGRMCSGPGECVTLFRGVLCGEARL